ncbi:hypothetical protein QJS04_geneDACA021637 [Acorus gramineus]|uniref:Uncharacterized protein n=1 Tax=Acorus gramineus TaxID=55184 RepID=A0AAV9AAZ7_ACOGR|nr:hypothetical protein QJS04_geneDACA021637 [Acorus gramineus]
MKNYEGLKIIAEYGVEYGSEIQFVCYTMDIDIMMHCRYLLLKKLGFVHRYFSKQCVSHFHTSITEFIIV